MEYAECKCKGCTNRHENCWSSCESYKKFKKYVHYLKHKNEIDNINYYSKIETGRMLKEHFGRRREK